MDSAQTIQLLESARKNLTEARRDVRSPRNEAGILLGLTAIGEIEQVVRGIAERVDNLEAAMGNEKNL